MALRNYTSFRVHASSDEGRQAERKAVEALDKHNLHHECYWSPSRKLLVVDVRGDWKHDHLAVEQALREAGFSSQGSMEIGEGESDYYEAEHYFKPEPDMDDAKLRSLSGKTLDGALDVLEENGFDVAWARKRDFSREGAELTNVGISRGDGKLLFLQLDIASGKIEKASWDTDDSFAVEGSTASLASRVRAARAAAGVDVSGMEGQPYEQAIKRFSEAGYGPVGYAQAGKRGFMQAFAKAGESSWYDVLVDGGKVAGVELNGSAPRVSSAKAGKDWSNVYVLRQEYNQYQKAWFPLIFYWNSSDVKPEGWVECLCTEDGRSYYHDEMKNDYYGISKPGTDKCSKEHVDAMLKQFQDENEGKTMYEVSKIQVYSPSRRGVKASAAPAQGRPRSAYAYGDRNVLAARKVDCKRNAVKEWMSDLGKPGVDCGTLYQYMNDTDFISLDELVARQNEHWKARLGSVLAEYGHGDRREAAGKICDMMDGYTLAVADGPDGSPWFLVWK